jgi:chromate transporter
VATRQRNQLQRAIDGINAAVVGVLGAPLYDPVRTNAIHFRVGIGLALAAFELIVYARLSPLIVVAMPLRQRWPPGA